MASAGGECAFECSRPRVSAVFFSFFLELSFCGFLAFVLYAAYEKSRSDVASGVISPLFFGRHFFNVDDVPITLAYWNNAASIACRQRYEDGLVKPLPRDGVRRAGADGVGE